MHFYLAILSFICSNALHASSQSVDLTNVAGARGVDVVEATIKRIEDTGLFAADFEFLKRIALIETNFGNNGSYGQGGIWNISPGIFSRLSNPSSQRILISFIARAILEFGPEFANLSNPNFNTPLRSAFAARLFLQLALNGSRVPGSLSSQARWWASNYNTGGDSGHFENVVTAHETVESCSVSKLDIWLLIDGSGSVGRTNFNATLRFVANLSGEFNVSPDEVRFGLSVYSGSHRFVSLFNRDTSNADFAARALSTAYPGGLTNTGRAINATVTTGFDTSNGLRPLSDGVPRVLVVLTDGRSGDDVLIPSELARQQGITVYGVGIGSNVNHAELIEIAGANSRVFELDNFDELISVLEHQLTVDACEVSAEIPENTTVAVSVAPGNAYYSSVRLPNNGSVQLEYQLDERSGGAGIVYGSLTVTNPNSALHDVSAVLTVGKTIVTVNCEGNGRLQLAGLLSRVKRSTDAIRCTTLFIALESTSTLPLQVNFTSTPSLTRAPVITRPATTTAASTPATRPTTTTPCDPPTTSKPASKRALHYVIPLISILAILAFASAHKTKF